MKKSTKSKKHTTKSAGKAKQNRDKHKKVKKVKKVSKQTRFVFDKRSSLSKKFSNGSSKPLKDRLLEQLRGSRFRYLNEQFYVSSSTDAKQYFAENPDEFKAYHEGYEQQASLWPTNPIDKIIKDVNRMLKSGKRLNIADFGCGQAKLAQTLDGTDNKVFSFDLIASNEYVTACDMSQTNLFSNSIDVAVFCLSLMGSNLSQFIKEANRVLKVEGLMKIAEVKSRFDKVEKFIQDIEQYGFTIVKKDLSDEAFYYFDFKKKSPISKHKKKKLPEIELKSCLYKQR